MKKQDVLLNLTHTHAHKRYEHEHASDGMMCRRVEGQAEAARVFIAACVCVGLDELVWRVVS